MTTPPRPLNPRTQALIQRVLGRLPSQLGAQARAATQQHAAPQPAAGPSLGDVIVLDTETTGVSRAARLVEIGAVYARDGVVVDTFQTLVHPEMKIPREVIHVHGITDAMVAHAPTAREALVALLQWSADAPWLAHNAAFDRRILTQELARTQLPSPKRAMHCTLRLARRAFPEMPDHRLGTLSSRLQLPHTPSHRAVADCHTTLALFHACVRRHGLSASMGWMSPAATL